MELPQFIEQQMHQFIDEQSLVEESKTKEELQYRGDERAGVILQKDYEKIVTDMIANGRVGDAKEQFAELKKKYNSIPRGNIYEKQVVFDVLQNVYSTLTEHVEDQTQKEDILLRMKGSSNVFDVNVKPVTIQYEDVQNAVKSAVEDALKQHGGDKPETQMPSPPKPEMEMPEKPPEIEEEPVAPEPEPELPPTPEVEEVPEPVVDEKLILFEEISKNLDDAELFLTHHKMHQAKDRLLAAKKELDNLPVEYHDDADSLFERYEDIKRELARQHMKKQEKIKSPIMSDELVAQYKQGLVYFFKGNYNKAADIFKIIVEENNTYLPAKIRLAECVERSKWKH